jgi:hypothetical protein
MEVHGMLRSRVVRHLAAAKVFVVAGLLLASGASGQVPVVTWAEPASAGLVPGGSAVTLIVHGRNLQLLDKAVIVAKGRKVNGTQATLQDGGSSSQRSVRISAGNKAKVGTQAVLQVSSGKGKQATNLDVMPVKIVATPPTWYEDMDGDGFGNPNVTREAAVQPSGFISESGDCDDTDPNFRPGADDPADDGVDWDCDGKDD